MDGICPSIGWKWASPKPHLNWNFVLYFQGISALNECFCYPVIFFFLLTDLDYPRSILYFLHPWLQVFSWQRSSFPWHVKCWSPWDYKSTRWDLVSLGNSPEQNKILFMACCMIPYISKNSLLPHKGLHLFSATESADSEGDKKAHNPEETRANCLTTVQILSLKIPVFLLWVSQYFGYQSVKCPGILEATQGFSSLDYLTEGKESLRACIVWA